MGDPCQLQVVASLNESQSWHSCCSLRIMITQRIANSAANPKWSTMIEKARERTKYVIWKFLQTEKHADLDTLAKALLAHETLTAQEIEQVLEGSLLKEPVAPEEAESDIAALLGPGQEPGGVAQPGGESL